MARINKVHVTEGQRVSKGDVIVELDHSRLDLKIASARAALGNRPRRTRSRSTGHRQCAARRTSRFAENCASEAATAEAEVAAEILEINRELNEHQAISRVELAQSRLASIQADLAKREKKIATEMALEGRESSVRIAESAIREAEMTLAYRLK